jgi:hypothetical protein
MVELLPGIDSIGESCSFPEDLSGFLWSIPEAFLGYNPFDFLKPLPSSSTDMAMPP